MAGYTWVLFLVGVCTLCVVCCQEADPVVITNYGSLRGLAQQDHLNRTYDAFLGVPFAKPPIADRRWTYPNEPPESWSGIRNATEFGPHPIQVLGEVYSFLGMGGNDSEDCLYLNIYVPGSVDEALARPLPVMIFFYGGAYIIGTTEMYPGQELATAGDVIVVTSTYRVSVMGFFSTGDDAAPGNYALWDAKSGLQWVNDNIGYFGGDASHITVFGHSAGSGMTEHCMLSPHINTMFHRAIGLSGSVSTVVGYTTDPKRNAQYLADVFFCNTTDSHEIVACLMEKEAKDLDTWAIFSIYRNESRVPNFMPVIDGNIVFQDTRKSFEEGVGKDLDFMTGRCVDDAGGLVLLQPLGAPPVIISPILNRTRDPNRNNEEIKQWFMTLLNFYENAEEIYYMLYEHNPDINSTDDVTCSMAASQVATDLLFQSGAHYDALKHAQAEGSGSTYLYQFWHRQSFLAGYPDWINGSHMDDIYSVLGDPFMKPFREMFLDPADFSVEDEEVSASIQKYYTNFAYTGNPNLGPHPVSVQWPEYNPSGDQTYLIESVTPWLESETPELIEELNWYLHEFWPLVRPAWANTTRETSPDQEEDARVVEETYREPIDETVLSLAIEEARQELYELVNYESDMMEAIDARIVAAIESRELYREEFLAAEWDDDQRE